MHTTQHRACFALLRIRWWRRQRVGYEPASLFPIHEESVHSKILPRSAVNSTPIWIQVVRIVCNSEIMPLRRSNPRRPADKGYLQRKPDLKPSSSLLDVHPRHDATSLKPHRVLACPPPPSPTRFIPFSPWAAAYSYKLSAENPTRCRAAGRAVARGCR